jgi:hypothetical protein
MKTNHSALRRYLRRSLRWSRTADATAPWQAAAGKATCRLRLNDFPAEPMYTLLVDGQPVGDLEDWPACWKQEPSIAGVATSKRLKATVTR